MKKQPGRDCFNQKGRFQKEFRRLFPLDFTVSMIVSVKRFQGLFQGVVLETEALFSAEFVDLG